jgi:hypothetical protein
MASLGHVAVGLAAARTYGEGRRPQWRSAVAWSVLSMLPDADVIGFQEIENPRAWLFRVASNLEVERLSVLVDERTSGGRVQTFALTDGKHAINAAARWSWRLRCESERSLRSTP